ncbi:MAG: nitroreductase family protein [Solirubrobacteraceae bacterium]
METWDAIRARRNVRSFEDRALSEADLDRILEAGRRAPSSRNWQPWDFVLVTDRDQLVKLSTVWQGAGHVAGSAATIALVLRAGLEGREREIALYDLGQATSSMQIAAADLGIGSGHSAIGDAQKASEILRLPEDRVVAYLIDLGYPADRPLAPLRKPDRRPSQDVVHRGAW